MTFQNVSYISHVCGYTYSVMTMSTVITIRMKSALITFSDKHLILYVYELQTASSVMLQVFFDNK